MLVEMSSDARAVCGVEPSGRNLWDARFGRAQQQRLSSTVPRRREWFHLSLIRDASLRSQQAATAAQQQLLSPRASSRGLPLVTLDLEIAQKVSWEKPGADFGFVLLAGDETRRAAAG
jgi:hypothetical protein